MLFAKLRQIGFHVDHLFRKAQNKKKTKKNKKMPKLVSFLQPYICSFARLLCTVDQLALQDVDHAIVESAILNLVDLQRFFDSREIQTLASSTSFDEDDLICLGLGDWEAVSAIFVQHEGLIEALNVGSGTKGLEAARKSVQGKAGSDVTVLTKATRRHFKRIDEMLIDRESSTMLRTLREVQTVILVVAFTFHSTSSSSSTSVAAKRTCKPYLGFKVCDALLCLLAKKPSFSNSVSEIRARLPWNDEREKHAQLLEKAPVSKVLVLQRFARRIISLRKLHSLQKQRSQNLAAFGSSVASQWRRALDASQNRDSVVKQILATELRAGQLQEYLENESELFKEEWRDWESKLKQFYMNECELDPATWKHVSVRDEASGELQAKFLDLRSGKLQVEHPMKARIFQIKQRQLLAATRTREATLARANSDMQEIHRAVAVDGTLSVAFATLRRSLCAFLSTK